MLIAFILAQQRVTVKPVEGERGKGRLQRWHRASFTFLLCHRLSSTRFSLLLFDNWNRKIVQLCCTGCKRPKRMPWLKFSPISLCSALPPLTLFLSFFFFAFVCWFTRANYLYTILVVRHMCRGCFACTPRHDRGGAYAAPSSPLKQGGNHKNSFCCLFSLDIASTLHPLALSWLVTLPG